ncbi:PREDICTED: serine/threonine/tyrosine-interacting protein isoform X1 [Ficedula albicollis]|uniref:serine/threonine/tyrosine-interacting protein isoform X1 n=1 Tax=Ficedula albicollis TaxID=59894 RepID=UPI000359672D|nr:PREDICTED: serine/threonine/tyrosine-interacting protein isoform X1 [Ficedula albicollis]
MELAKPAFPALPQAKEDSEDWTYPMRREMQEILPGLFLGPYSSAMKSKLPILQKHGITHVICIRQNIEANFIKPNFQQLFRYLVLDIADNPVENIIRFFPMTKEFIDGSLQSGGKVLVHGNAGISRSAALVIAYIMETFGVKYRDAFTYVQERRFCINPNAGFVHQLQVTFFFKFLIVTEKPFNESSSCQTDIYTNMLQRNVRSWSKAWEEDEWAPQFLTVKLWTEQIQEWRRNKNPGLCSD